MNKIKKLFFRTKVREGIQAITFEQAFEKIQHQEIMANIKSGFILARNILFLLVVMVEMLMASCFSGVWFDRPLFALVEWSILVVTIVVFFRILVKSISERYLTKYYSSCAMLLLLLSLLFDIFVYLLFWSHSSKDSENPFVQSIILIVTGGLLALVVYRYLYAMVIEELSEYMEGVVVPKIIKILHYSFAVCFFSS